MSSSNWKMDKVLFDYVARILGILCVKIVN